jgi:tetratricopeptide (TPR) repeat protein
VSAQTIKNERDFNQALTRINLSYDLTLLEKEQSLLQLFTDVSSMENPLYSALLAHKIGLLADKQHDKTKSLHWREFFNRSLKKVISKQSLEALKQLSILNRLTSLQNDSQHSQAIEIAVDLLTAMNNSPVKNMNINNNKIYISEIDIAYAHRILGKSYYSTAEYEQAQISFLKGLEYYEKHQHSKEISGSYNSLSSIMWAQGDLEQALIYSNKT